MIIYENNFTLFSFYCTYLILSKQINFRKRKNEKIKKDENT